MLLAQAADPSNTGGTWAIASGIVAMLLTNVGKWIFDSRKDRKDEIYQAQKDARETEDRQKDYLLNTQIRDCLNQIEVSNTKNHGVVLLALKETCKADCENYRPNKNQRHENAQTPPA